jgi:pyruvate,orthophosphate dikinase
MTLWPLASDHQQHFADSPACSLLASTLSPPPTQQAKFLQFYTKNGLLALDPFETVDFVGVGELIKLAVARGRETRPDIELGICGEHGGDPKSIELFETVGLDYVSCSPLRVPIARLAAAQAFLKAQKAKKA